MNTHAPTRATLLMLAAASGMGAANLYYCQPLLPKIAAALRLSNGVVGLVPFLTQIGYAAGLLLVVPLCDYVQPRRLLSWMSVQTSATLVAVGAARNGPWLIAGSFLLGGSTVVPQIAVPIAAKLSSTDRRGRAVTIVMTGLLVGVVGARAFAGFIAAASSWRWTFYAGAIAMGVLGVALWLGVPRVEKTPGQPPYPMVLRTLVGVARADPALRWATLVAALGFGGLSCFWVTVVFYVAGAPYRAGPAMIGVLALVGVCGAVIVSMMGRHRPRRPTVPLALACCCLGFVVLGGYASLLPGLVAGTVLVDAGNQVNEVSNLVGAMAHRTSEHGRANTVFMSGLFLGGAAGSGLGDLAWSVFGWRGACAVGLGFCLTGLGFHMRKGLDREPVARVGPGT